MGKIDTKLGNMLAPAAAGLALSLLLGVLVSGAALDKSIPFWALAALLSTASSCLAAFVYKSRTLAELKKEIRGLQQLVGGILQKASADSTQLKSSDLPSYESKTNDLLPDWLGGELVLLQYSLQSLVEQVKETRKREKSVIENAADVICVIDIKSRILQMNPASKSVFGYRPDELIGKELVGFMVQEDQSNTLQSVLGAEKSIDRIFFENKFKKKSGELIDLLWSAHWSASDGGLFCVAHDITERKRAEQLLRESEERVSSILEHLPAGVVLVNRNGYIEFMNGTGQVLSGRADEQVKGSRASDLLSFCKEPFTAKQLDDLINKHETGFESQVTRSNGERFHAEISISNIKVAGEKCFLVIFIDASSKHAIETAKREFVAMVGHDLRTPLTSILSILSYLEAGHGGQLNQTAGSLVSRGRQETNRLIDLIKDLLDLEKMKAGKFSMHMSQTDLKDVIQAAVNSASRHAELHKVKIETIAGGDLKVSCDGARIIQVLVNLLDNAIKFSPADETVIVEGYKGANSINVSVSNKGREIPPDKLSAIFLKFEQVEESDSREKKGTGLGLAICKTIIEQHSGKITVNSSAQSGTKFVFELPLFSSVDGEKSS